MRVLFVCHGNVCRSALAEYLLRDALHARGVAASAVTVSSCGLLRLDGYPMDERYVRLLAARDVDGTVHRSTPFSPALALDADLTLVFTRDQADELLGYAPAVARRTFLLDDFANLCAACVRDGDLEDVASPDDRLRAMLLAAPFKRPLLPRTQDIQDPHRQSDEVYAQVADEIAARVAVVADALAGAAAA
ncbi:hypothetical protein JS531_02500 [Bifidobacterium sp. CP2]|uniref:arsenate reductase/protein-tyrosine-phosphatase family protein n=1 Tax=Bifidobacterium sp. CP2 TaxID=2809025 RepID=UPI001BDCCF12|nr:hypothetical protein [Bifidobacterium sp. CP2]MBT1180860.1 hypothetical protein [Bifidobacterium sp. CP2]